MSFEVDHSTGTKCIIDFFLLVKESPGTKASQGCILQTQKRYIENKRRAFVCVKECVKIWFNA